MSKSNGPIGVELLGGGPASLRGPGAGKGHTTSAGRPAPQPFAKELAAAETASPERQSELLGGERPVRASPRPVRRPPQSLAQGDPRSDVLVVAAPASEKVALAVESRPEGAIEASMPSRRQAKASDAPPSQRARVARSDREAEVVPRADEDVQPTVPRKGGTPSAAAEPPIPSPQSPRALPEKTFAQSQPGPSRVGAGPERSGELRHLSATSPAERLLPDTSPREDAERPLPSQVHSPSRTEPADERGSQKAKAEVRAETRLQPITPPPAPRVDLRRPPSHAERMVAGPPSGLAQQVENEPSPLAVGARGVLPKAETEPSPAAVRPRGSAPRTQTDLSPVALETPRAALSTPSPARAHAPLELEAASTAEGARVARPETTPVPRVRPSIEAQGSREPEGVRAGAPAHPPVPSAPLANALATAAPTPRTPPAHRDAAHLPDLAPALRVDASPQDTPLEPSEERRGTRSRATSATLDAPSPVPAAAVADAPAPSASAPPAQASSSPLLGSDELLYASLSAHSAHLSVQTGDAGTLDVSLRVRHGVADVSATGPGATLLEGKEGELRLALLQQGLQLGDFGLGADARHRRDGQEPPDRALAPEARPQRKSGRAAIGPQTSTVESTASAGASRLHLKA